MLDDLDDKDSVQTTIAKLSEIGDDGTGSAERLASASAALSGALRSNGTSAGAAQGPLAANDDEQIDLKQVEERLFSDWDTNGAELSLDLTTSGSTLCLALPCLLSRSPRGRRIETRLRR